MPEKAVISLFGVDTTSLFEKRCDRLGIAQAFIFSLWASVQTSPLVGLQDTINLSLHKEKLSVEVYKN